MLGLFPVDLSESITPDVTQLSSANLLAVVALQGNTVPADPNVATIIANDPQKFFSASATPDYCKPDAAVNPTGRCSYTFSEKQQETFVASDLVPVPAAAGKTSSGSLKFSEWTGDRCVVDPNDPHRAVVISEGTIVCYAYYIYEANAAPAVVAASTPQPSASAPPPPPLPVVTAPPPPASPSCALSLIVNGTGAITSSAALTSSGAPNAYLTAGKDGTCQSSDTLTPLASCSEFHKPGESLTLTPSTLYTTSDGTTWNLKGLDCGTGASQNPVQVTFASSSPCDQTCTATYTAVPPPVPPPPPPPPILTVAVDGPGTIKSTVNNGYFISDGTTNDACTIASTFIKLAAPCTQTYTSGTSETLTAYTVNQKDYQFDHWSSDTGDAICSGTNPSISFTVDHTFSCTAHFVTLPPAPPPPPPPVVTLSISTMLNGVKLSPGTAPVTGALFNPATVAPYYTFYNSLFPGSVTVSGSNVNIQGLGTVPLGASYTVNQWTMLSLDNTNGFSVTNPTTLSPCGTYVFPGAYYFNIAFFDSDPFTPTAFSSCTLDTSGITTNTAPVTSIQAQDVVLPNSVDTISQFQQWNCNDDPVPIFSRTINPQRYQSCTAYYAYAPYTAVSLAFTGGDTTKSVTGTGTLPNMVVNPNILQGVTDFYSNSTGKFYLPGDPNMPADATQADHGNFNCTEGAVVPDPNAAGNPLQGAGNTCDLGLGQGGIFTLTAIAAGFQSWSSTDPNNECNGTTAPSCTFTVRSTPNPMVMTANYAPPPPPAILTSTLTINVTGSGTCAINSQLNNGYFVNNGITGAACTITPPAQDQNAPPLTAACVQTYTYTNGAPQTDTLTASAVNGSLGSWGGDCGGSDPTNPTATIKMDQNHTCSFTCNATDSLSVILAGSGSGTITSTDNSANKNINCTISPCSETVTSGTLVTLTATPASGSTFTNWSGACSGTASSCTVTVNQATSVTATFSITPIYNVISAGIEHFLLVKSDSSVWAWGYNGFGEVGDGTTTRRDTPVQVSGLTGVATVAAGGQHSMALKHDGSVWTWGFNRSGELGDGTTIQRTTPVQTSGLSNITAIAGGGGHSLALASDGTVWAWGGNWYGALGTGDTNQRLSPVQVTNPNDPSGLLTGITAIAAGSYYSLAIDSTGKVWAWGDNSYGQLGTGDTTEQDTPIQVSGLAGVIGIGGGWGFSLALTKDSKGGTTVWAWGDNSYGELGNGDTTGAQQYNPVQVVNSSDPSGFLTGITSIDTGDFNSLAVDKQGQMWAWGLNSSGQLGIVDPNIVKQYTPASVSGLTGIIYLDGGGSHAIAIKNDGSLWTWGYNGPAGLKEGPVINNRTDPQQVQITTGY